MILTTGARQGDFKPRLGYDQEDDLMAMYHRTCRYLPDYLWQIPKATDDETREHERVQLSILSVILARVRNRRRDLRQEKILSEEGAMRLLDCDFLHSAISAILHVHEVARLRDKFERTSFARIANKELRLEILRTIRYSTEALNMLLNLAEYNLEDYDRMMGIADYGYRGLATVERRL